VTALVARGRAGYPTVEVTRASVATDPREPGTALVVQSSAGQLAVDTGVISCADSDGCPSPMECDIGSKICK
jgi:hypothetical protein